MDSHLFTPDITDDHPHPQKRRWSISVPRAGACSPERGQGEEHGAERQWGKKNKQAVPLLPCRLPSSQPQGAAAKSRSLPLRQHRDQGPTFGWIPLRLLQGVILANLRDRLRNKGILPVSCASRYFPVVSRKESSEILALKIMGNENI